MRYEVHEANKSVEVCITLTGPILRDVVVLLFADYGSGSGSGSGSGLLGSGNGMNGSRNECLLLNASEILSYDGNMPISQDVALPELDYRPLSSFLIFSTQGTQCGMVELIEDSTLENEEIFNVTIESDITVLLQTAEIILLDSDGELKTLLL